jgi:threonine dehydratase
VNVPSYQDVLAAAERIRGQVRRTPVLELAGSEVGVSGRIVLKLELLQHVGVLRCAAH